MSAVRLSSDCGSSCPDIGLQQRHGTHSRRARYGQTSRKTRIGPDLASSERKPADGGKSIRARKGMKAGALSIPMGALAGSIQRVFVERIGGPFFLL